MYNPSRGGVRGGADQFTWESVKTDKHRENYLGHSLMAPVGRWQKGKDLSWYAKDRKDDKAAEIIEKSEFASIKKAEEEAMLIALGHNIVRKTQTLTKEDMREALKRNTERDDHHIERIDGVGASSHRIASLSGVRKDSRLNNEGVAFETVRERNISKANDNDKEDRSKHEERKRNKKNSKKYKKEKKHKKHHKESHHSESSDDSSKHKSKNRKSEIDDSNKKSLKVKYPKESKYKHKNYSSDSDQDRKSSKLKSHKPRGRDNDDSDSLASEDKNSLKMKWLKKSKIRQDYSSYSDSPTSVLQHKTKHKKSHLNSDDSDEKSHSDSHKKDHKRHKKQRESVKRHRHDTSESD